MRGRRNWYISFAARAGFDLLLSADQSGHLSLALWHEGRRGVFNVGDEVSQGHKSISKRRGWLESIDDKAREKLDAENREAAKYTWTQKDAVAAKSLDAELQFGQNAIRSVGVINAAAIAALLGFLSANAKSMMSLPDEVRSSLSIFIVGVMASPLSFGSAYISQSFFTRAEYLHEKTFKHPYVTDKSGKDIILFWAGFFKVLSIFMVVIGFSCFMLGSWWFVQLVTKVILLPQLR